MQTLAVPAVGEEREVEVGSVILSTGEAGVSLSGLRLTADTTVRGKRAGADFTVSLPAGNLPGPGYGRDLFMVTGATFRYDREKGERRGLSKPDIGVYVDPANDTRLVARLVFGFSKLDVPIPDAQFQIDRCIWAPSGGLRREILYSGGSKGTITLQYREYVNNLARPAFSQELSYDLADGNEIGFKGARIRIIKVSNTGVRYVVLKQMTD